MEQRCDLSAVWLTWLGLPLLAAVVGLRLGLVAAFAVLGAGVIGQVRYVRRPLTARGCGGALVPG